MPKQRIGATTYTVTLVLGGQPITLGALKSIPVGHRVYFVNVLNPSGNATQYAGSNQTAEYQLVAGASKDFYFVDPALIQFKQTAAQTIYVDVSGEFPGDCPICDRADG